MIDLTVIVIGGSAGALEALVAALPALPASFAIPIVVVLHLPADQPSLVPEVLGRVCRRRVCEAEDKQPLAGDTIFVAPPGYHLLIERTAALALSVDAPVHFSRPSIDVLFESAADAFGDRVAGLVLSGSSSDGAAGLTRIAAAGGVAAVHDPRAAPHAAMPAAALASAGPATHVVATAELAGFLACLGEVRPRGSLA